MDDSVRKTSEREWAVCYLHWIKFAPPLALLFLGLGFLSVAIINRTKEISIIGGFLTLAALVWLFLAVVQYVTAELAVTNRRIILKRGIIGHHAIELPISEIESVSIVQSTLGRILNYGTIIMRGHDADLGPVELIAEPARVRQAVQRGIEYTNERNKNLAQWYSVSQAKDVAR